MKDSAVTKAISMPFGSLKKLSIYSGYATNPFGINRMLRCICDTFFSTLDTICFTSGHFDQLVQQNSRMRPAGRRQRQGKTQPHAQPA